MQQSNNKDNNNNNNNNISNISLSNNSPIAPSPVTASPAVNPREEGVGTAGGGQIEAGNPLLLCSSWTLPTKQPRICPVKMRDFSWMTSN